MLEDLRIQRQQSWPFDGFPGVSDCAHLPASKKEPVVTSAELPWQTVFCKREAAINFWDGFVKLTTKLIVVEAELKLI